MGYRINRTVTFEQLKAQFGRLKKGVPAQFEKQLPRIAQDSVVVLRQNTRRVSPHAPIDTMRFLRGWRVSFPRRYAVTVYNDAPYADVLERGRRPHRKPPPSRALYKWVQRKLKVSKKEAPGVAFVVARAIGRRGWRGKFILFRSMPSIRAIYKRRLQLAMERAMRDAAR
jgi:hypothetical protein